MNDYTVKELKQLCKKNDIKGCYGKKADIYQKLVDNNVLEIRGRSKSRSGSLIRSKEKECPNGKVLNPTTNRCIKIGGPAHYKLEAKGVIQKTKKSRSKSRIKSTKPCMEGMIRNPDSGRCIKIGGPAYKKLLKDGKITERLPHDMWFQIALNTELRDLKSLCKTNKDIQGVCKLDYFWKEKYKYEYEKYPTNTELKEFKFKTLRTTLWTGKKETPIELLRERYLDGLMTADEIRDYIDSRWADEKDYITYNGISLYNYIVDKYLDPWHERYYSSDGTVVYNLTTGEMRGKSYRGMSYEQIQAYGSGEDDIILFSK